MTYITKSREWSGSYEDGTGNRMGHDEDSTFYPACPLCGGIKPHKMFKGSYLEKQVGHRKGCDFLRVSK